MSRRAEAIKTESFCVARKAKRAPADETGTEQRRKRGGVAFFAQAKSIACVGDRVGRVAAVSRVAGEDRPVAKIFPLAHAIGADAAGRSKPGNADPLSKFQTFDVRAERIDSPDDFMARNDRELRVRQLAIDNMEIGPADAACFHPDPKLARAGDGIGQFLEDQRPARFVQDHAKHRRPLDRQVNSSQAIKGVTRACSRDQTGSTEATWNVCRSSSSRTDT